MQGTQRPKYATYVNDISIIRSDAPDNHLVKQETHKIRSDSRIANPNIPSRPLLFEPAERQRIDTLIVLLAKFKAAAIVKFRKLMLRTKYRKTKSWHH